MNIDESRTKKSINNIIGGLMFKLIALIFPFIISLQKVLQNNWSDNFSSRINFITILKIFN